MTTTFNQLQSKSSPILERQSPPEPISESFHGKKYKKLTIAGDALSSMVSALFYKILSLACWIVFQKSASHRYSQLATYHCQRMGSRPLAYMIFGDKIINFAMNSTGTVVDLKEKDTNEINELKKNLRGLL